LLNAAKAGLFDSVALTAYSAKNIALRTARFEVICGPITLL